MDCIFHTKKEIIFNFFWFCSICNRTGTSCYSTELCVVKGICLENGYLHCVAACFQVCVGNFRVSIYTWEWKTWFWTVGQLGQALFCVTCFASVCNKINFMHTCTGVKWRGIVRVQFILIFHMLIAHLRDRGKKVLCGDGCVSNRAAFCCVYRYAKD